MPSCAYCQALLRGRSDKKFCDSYCKSSHQYKQEKESAKTYKVIERQLKANRKVLKSYNKKGMTTVRISELEKEGFNARFFTHYWKNASQQTYLFCFEYGFLRLTGSKKGKMLLVQLQEYMLSDLGIISEGTLNN